MQKSNRKNWPRNEEGELMTEEEVDRAMEREQQKVTLCLQQIDNNIANCNHILSSKILPQLDRFQQASAQVWDRSKPWLYFFQCMNEQTQRRDDTASVVSSQHYTNRPYFDDFTARTRLSHEITMRNITEPVGDRVRQSLQQPAGIPLDTRSTPSSQSSATPNSITSESNKGKEIRSPPHIMPRGIAASSLRGTPIHEQAKILSDNRYQAASLGVNDSDSDGLNSPASQSVFKKPTSQAQPYDEHMMETETAEDKRNLDRFMSSREIGSRIEQLPIYKSPVPSPSARHDQYFSQSLLAGSPTVQRVMTHTQQNIKRKRDDQFTFLSSASPSLHHTSMSLQAQEQRQEEAEENMPMYEDEVEDMQITQQNVSTPSSSFFQLRSSSNTPIVRSDRTPTAYEFENPMSAHTPTHSHSQSLSTVDDDQHSTQSSALFMPPEFDVTHFPTQWHVSPYSTKLKKVYQIFDSNPSTMLTVEEVVKMINVPGEYDAELVQLLIKMMTDRKFLRRMDSRKAWTVRR